MFICGSGSFSHLHEDETESYSSPCPTPKRSKRNTSFCKIIGKDNNNKNPYAKRGLDKFYALLADLDNKKQKIYTQKGAEDISFVRFVYTNDSNQVKPIVVKVKEKNQAGLIKKSFKKNSSNLNQVVASQSTAEVPKEEPNEKRRKKRRCLRCNGSFKLDNLRQPYVYFPVIVVLVLMFLAMYGRSFAILCTSIGWYMVPTIIGGRSPPPSSSSSNERKPKRKKEYARKQSEKKINVHSEGPSSPKSVINGLVENK
ncbi:hypothetical protein PHJA_002233900 [Phtheirospermum japonicum]|uniref:ZCF37 n=1 Tax=Phtheirospermum japonicum TaxID=374723 RepID=A0A830CPJ2_9LAMI|nr:hypothetical protein PHJA_002233900 [Phtheirospermum japonicum]